MNAALIGTNDNQLEQCLVNMTGGVKHAILDLLTFLLHTLQHVDERYRAEKLPYHVFWHILLVFILELDSN